MVKEKTSMHFLGGVSVMALLAGLAFFLAGIPFIKHLAISPLIIGIVLGMVYAHSLRVYLPTSWRRGELFCSKRLLRLAIIFYGFRLNYENLMAMGWYGIAVDITIVSSVVILGFFLGKLFKMDRDTALLVSSGSAICGAAAVLGTEPVLKSAPHKTAIAVSTVVIFGTLSMFIYPLAYRLGLLHLSPHAMALYTGATVHEVAHVVGAAHAMNDPFIVHHALIVKMMRVVLLAPFLLILSVFVSSKRCGESSASIFIPWFAIGFLCAIAIHSLGIFSQQSVVWICFADNFALTMAMTALGASMHVKQIKEAGIRPFALAFILYLWLIFVGYWLAKGH